MYTAAVSSGQIHVQNSNYSTNIKATHCSKKHHPTNIYLFKANKNTKKGAKYAQS